MNGSVGQNLGDDAVLLAAVHGRGVEPLGLEHGGHDARLLHHRVAEGDGDNVGISISELNCLSSTSIMAPSSAALSPAPPPAAPGPGSTLPGLGDPVKDAGLQPKNI